MPGPARYPVSGGLVAGAYPDGRSPVERLESEGIGLFVDLTHPSDPLEGYARHLREARRSSHPIPDMGTPTPGLVMAILDEIDAALADAERVYVHCWGGVGRTGTVVGCWLVRHGLDEGDAVRSIGMLRRQIPGSRGSPETPGQIALVQSWRRGR